MFSNDKKDSIPKSECERQLRLLTENIKAQIAHVNLEQRFTFVNKRYADRFGLLPEDIQGKRVEDVLGPAGYGTIKTQLIAALEGEPQAFETNVESQAGETHRFDITCAPDVSPDGERKGVYVMILDITESWRLQRSLKEQNELILSIINSTQDPIFARDLDGRQLMMNKAGAALFGLSPEDTIGKKTSELFSEEVANEFLADDQRVIASGLPGSSESELQIGTTMRYYQTIKTPIRNQHGEIEGIVGIARDITGTRRTEQELRRTTEYLDSVLSNITAGLAIFEGPDLRYTRINQVLADINGVPMEYHIGKTVPDILPDAVQFIMPTIEQAVKTGKSTPYHEFSAILPGGAGQLRWYMFSAFPIQSEYGKPESVGVIVLDTTDRKQVEESLASANEQIDTERKALEAKNIALQEWMSHANEQRDRLVRQVRSNVEQIIFPILSKLETKSEASVQQYIKLIKSNLREITSSFVGEIAAETPALSPRELQIVNMVREGMSSKEIASILDTAEATVRKQRKTIRKKLGISNQSVNLRTFLQSSQFQHPGSGVEAET